MIYLTKYMIEDYLKKHGILVKVLGKEPWKFTSFSSQLCADNPDILYILRNEKDFERSKGRVCFVRIVQKEILENMIGEQEALLCCGKENEIIEIIAECFAFYKDWYISMQDELLQGGNFQRLVDLSIPVFKNPIAVSDTGFQVLAFTREYHSQMQDEESRFILKNGFHSPAYIQQITHHAIFLENLKKNMGPFRYHYDFLQHESIYCTVWRNGKPSGVLTIVGKNSIEGRALIDAARIFAEILSQAFRQDTGKAPALTLQEKIFINVLRGDIDDKTVVYETCSELNITKENQYKIVCARMQGLRPGKNALMTKAKMLFSEKIKKGKVLYDQDMLVLLVPVHIFDPEELLRLLSSIFAGYSCYIGISYSFQSVETIALYYRQAKRCAEVVETLPDKAFLNYETWMVRDLLYSQLTEAEKNAAIHPAVLLMKEREKTEQTMDLLDTVKAYLRAGRNGTVAAKQMHIHKNTLYYRLKQAEELTGVDFNDPDVCECLKISIYLSELSLA